MQITEVENAREFQAGNARARNASATKALLHGKENSLNNYQMTLTTMDEPHPTPRHRHNFEQVRFSFAGSFEYAKDVSIPPGQLMYFPESVYYGPQIRRDSTVLTTQFGGASGYGFLSERQRRDAYDTLSKTGKFEKGWYTHTDEHGRKHNVDTFDVIYNHVRGKLPVMPEARYADLILINPQNYAWIDSAKEPGIAHKWFGTFTEREFRMGFIRVDQGATLSVTAKRAPEILFMLEGAVSLKGQSYAGQTAIGVDSEDGSVSLKAEKPSIFYYMKLHDF